MNVPDLPFVGRTDELDSLTAFLRRVRDGRPGAALVQGGAGVGKTRLVKAACATAGDDVTWARGTAFELETSTPYGVFAEALAPLVRSIEEHRLEVLTRGWSHELAVLLPGVLPPPEAGDALRTLTSDEAIHRLRWILRDFLLRLATQRPLVLVLDDLQWADEASLDLLHFLTRSLEDDVPLGILGAMRTDGAAHPETLAEVRQSLRRMGRLELLELDELAPDDVAILLRDTFGLSGRMARETAADLHQWTGGNPFYLGEMLRTWIDSGTIHPEGEVWVGWNDRDLVLPESLEQLLGARLDVLSPGALRVAEHAAALGRESREGWLQAVTGMEEADLLAGLEELVDGGLLASDGDDTEPSYHFPHDLQRTAAYERISTARRRRMHARIAETLLDGRERGGDPVASFEVANHLLRTPPDSLSAEGRDALVEAAEAALDVGAHELAERCFRFVLAGREGSRDARARGGLARSLQRQGDFEEADGILARARDEARSVDDRAAEADALRSLGLSAYWQGQRERALELLSAAREVAGDTGGVERLARIELARGACLQELGRLDEAARTLEEGLAALGSDGLGPELTARFHRGLFMAHAWSGDTGLAWEHGRAAEELAGQVGELDLSWSIHWARAVVSGLTGDAERFVEAMEDLRRVEAGLRSPLRRILLAELEIHYSWATGAWDDGLSAGEEAIRLARELDQQPLLARILVWTAELLLHRGERERAREHFEEAWEAAGGDGPLSGDIHARVAAHAGMAHLAMEEGRHDDAVELAKKGLALASEVGYVVWGIYQLLPVLAEALFRARRVEEAALLGQRLRHDSAAFGHRLGLAWADAVDALSAWLGGDLPRAATLLEASADAMEAIPMLPDSARLRRQLAGRLAELDRRDEALDQLRKVHEQFERMGAQPELDKARGMFRELGARPPARGQDEGLEALTEREMEVARMVARGHSNKSAGKELGIAHRTVGTHLARIYRKLGISSRAALAAEVVAREGEIPE